MVNIGLKVKTVQRNPRPSYLFMTQADGRGVERADVCVQTREALLPSPVTSAVARRHWRIAAELAASVHQWQKRTVFLLNSRMNTNQFFDFVLAEFSIACEVRTKSQAVDAAESMATGLIPGLQAAVLTRMTQRA